MVDSAADLSQAEWENLATQVDTLRDQLQDVLDDQAVQSILDEAKPQAVAVQASVAAVNTAVCTAGSATTSGGTWRPRRGASPRPAQGSSTTHPSSQDDDSPSFGSGVLKRWWSTVRVVHVIAGGRAPCLDVTVPAGRVRREDPPRPGRTERGGRRRPAFAGPVRSLTSTRLAWRRGRVKYRQPVHGGRLRRNDTSLRRSRKDRSPASPSVDETPTVLAHARDAYIGKGVIPTGSDDTVGRDRSSRGVHRRATDRRPGPTPTPPARGPRPLRSQPGRRASSHA